MFIFLSAGHFPSASLVINAFSSIPTVNTTPGVPRQTVTSLMSAAGAQLLLHPDQVLLVTPSLSDSTLYWENVHLIHFIAATVFLWDTGFTTWEWTIHSKGCCVCGVHCPLFIFGIMFLFTCYRTVPLMTEDTHPHSSQTPTWTHETLYLKQLFLQLNMPMGSGGYRFYNSLPLYCLSPRCLSFQQ